MVEKQNHFDSLEELWKLLPEESLEDKTERLEQAIQRQEAELLRSRKLAIPQLHIRNTLIRLP